MYYLSQLSLFDRPSNIWRGIQFLNHPPPSTVEFLIGASFIFVYTLCLLRHAMGLMLFFIFYKCIDTVFVIFFIPSILISQVLVYSSTAYFRQLGNERQNSMFVAVSQLLHLLVTSLCYANIKSVLI